MRRRFRGLASIFAFLLVIGIALVLHPVISGQTDPTTRLKKQPPPPFAAQFEERLWRTDGKSGVGRTILEARRANGDRVIKRAAIYPRRNLRIPPGMFFSPTARFARAFGMNSGS